MPRRSPETLADYLVVAICPALIMLLVGSLMWFLVEVFYQGEHKGRLLWVMAMFVLAIVGIARIAMEKGLAYAAMFGWALAAAIAMALSQFVKDGLVIGGPIMVLVWWAAHKLTWDCTLIDDSQDATGQGLLQQMGLDRSAAKASNALLGTTTRAGELEATTALPQPMFSGANYSDASPTPPWWETLLEPDRRPHAPGVWVVYFSLAALPLFGFGGWFVSDPVVRARVFGLLVIYVACGMGLLLATSFLGLRRYLRQRKLEMPLEMTTTWILVGVVMICAMLLLAAILPRPSREYSLSQLPFTVTSAARKASKIAFGREGTKDDATRSAAKGEAQDGQQTDRSNGASGKSEKQQQSSDSSSGKGRQGKAAGDSAKSQSESSGDKSGKEGKSQSGGAKGGDAKGSKSDNNSDKTAQNPEQKSDQQSPQQDPPQQDPAQSNTSPSRNSFNPLSLLGKLLGLGIKWLFYAGLIVGLLSAAWIYRDELQAAWQKLMHELRELWDWWFGKAKATEAATIPSEIIAPPRTFASYSDPFSTGNARGMSWPQLVRYTFEALEAWGREHDCPRSAGQTANEFALALSALEPEIAAATKSLAASYSQLAYANQAAAASPEPLRQLWTQLSDRRAHLATA